MAIRTVEFNGAVFDISYQFEGDPSGKKALFLHGWGANKELMKNSFASKMGKYSMLFVDLPGFGKSTSSVALTTNDYYLIINLFLSRLNFAPDLIVAHSFGGKIATLLDPDLLVLLSSAGIVKTKSLKVKCKILLAKIFKFLGIRSSFLRTKDAEKLPEHMYQTLKNVVDEDFSAIFGARSKKTAIFWGKNDTATPLVSGEKIHALIKNSKFFPLDGDHFFFINQSDLIAGEIELAMRSDAFCV